MHIRILSSIFVILSISSAHTAAVQQPDDMIAPPVSGRPTTASTTPSKPPLDVRLAHWASMALAGLVAVDGLWDVFSIIANTNRWETVKSAPHDPHPFLQMPHEVVEQTAIHRLVNASKPGEKLDLNQYENRHNTTYTPASLDKLASDTKATLKQLWPGLNFDVDGCFEEAKRMCASNVHTIEFCNRSRG
jgi:hypothetical protein